VDKSGATNHNELMQNPASIPILLTSVFIIATCGILYELLISSISSYLLGSSILHFSLTIGIFLSFMGVGAYLSKFIEDEHLLSQFVMIEIWLGLIGGASGVILYTTYAFTLNYYLITFLLIAVIGSLVGLEIPLLTRIVRNYFNLKDTLAQVLSFDYLGALLASILFPLFLLPYLGLTRTSFFIGLLNLSVGLFNIWVFRKNLQKPTQKLLIASFATIIYVIGFFYAFGISTYLEQFLYQDDIIVSQQSPYQKIVVTRWNNDVRLFLNGNLQFSSVDEHRYHESLVHIPLAMTPNPETVLLLGAGDGLAVREILKNPKVKQIHLVDLDKEMIALAQTHDMFKRLNDKSLQSPKVKVIIDDAYKFIEKTENLYSLIIIDLPDPSDVAVGKLYTKEFYELCKKRMTRDGVIITQASSPFFARPVFWCIKQTMAAVFPSTIPYTVHVPAFGQWGFQMALNYSTQSETKDIAQYINRKLFQENKILFRYLTPEVTPTLFVFDRDMQEIPTKINTLNTQQLVQYYDRSWAEFND
jgi:spermidine synthase